MKKIMVILVLGMWLSACGGGTGATDESNQGPNNDPREEMSNEDGTGDETQGEVTTPNTYSVLDEYNDSLDGTTLTYKDYFISLEQAASLTIELSHGEGVDFDFALFDHNDNQIDYSYSPQLVTRLKEYLVPNPYRIRVYTESNDVGTYTLKLSANGLSYDGNNAWGDSIELDGVKQDELTPYSSGLLDLMDFYSFILEEDSLFSVSVDKADDTSRYQLSVYDADKNLLSSDISSLYDLAVGGAVFSGQYYLVVDAIEANSYGTYDIAITTTSLEVDELSSIENPIALTVDEWVKFGSLNVNSDAEDVFRLDVTLAGTHMFELSIGDALSDGEFRIMVYDENGSLVSEGYENQPNFAELEVGTYFIKAQMLKGLGSYWFIGRYWE